MIREIVFATNNINKLKELREIVGDKFKILSLEDINCRDEIVEDGSTFKENALIKARFIKDNYGYDCFADDSGLEVNALDGAPGVYSARYAGKDCNSEKNIDKLLILMGDCQNRNARFVTVFTLIIEQKVYFFNGEIKGTILHERRGDGGFGYDSVFLPEGYNKSFAEMNSSEKNEISHRGLATKKLIDFLQTIIG
ncbi:MAG: non-canonical purine NTP diphosphatase [Muribaculaceae bacterium]|nr:non-canonical purine NTP diphosphatase [Muribaculaceae bacterium]